MRRSSSARSAEIWGRTFPRAFRLAHLLVGDLQLAERIAERTFVRSHVRYRNVSGDEGHERWTLRTVVRLSHSRVRLQAFRRRTTRPSDPLSTLRFRRRAAYVLSVYEDLDAGAMAHALDCSPGGAIALLEGAERSFMKSGVEPPSRVQLSRHGAELPVPPLKIRALKRASRSRAVSSIATVMFLLVSGFVGVRSLTASNTPEVDDIRFRVCKTPPTRGPTWRASERRAGAHLWRGPAGSSRRQPARSGKPSFGSISRLPGAATSRRSMHSSIALRELLPYMNGRIMDRQVDWESSRSRVDPPTRTWSGRAAERWPGALSRLKFFSVATTRRPEW